MLTNSTTYDQFCLHWRFLAKLLARGVYLKNYIFRPLLTLRKNKNSNDNANAALAVDGRVWVCSVPLFGAFDIRNMLSEMFWFCIGLVIFVYSLEVVVNVF